MINYYYPTIKLSYYIHVSKNILKRQRILLIHISNEIKFILNEIKLIKVIILIIGNKKIYLA